MAKIYVNDPFTVDIPFTDEDGAVIDITGGTVTCEVYLNESLIETLDGGITEAASGTGYANVPADTCNSANDWVFHGRVLLSGTNWRAEATTVTITAVGTV